MDKQKKIVRMFDQIASTYDLANRVLSFGSDVAWRKKACDKAFELYGKNRIETIADVACGTGDMLGFWQKRAQRSGISVGRFWGIDPSRGMLEIAKEKFKDFEYMEAFAQDLPIDSDSCDIVSISYGIRNVTERDKALKEFNRVLKDGGMLVILEFTKRERRGLSDMAVEFYMKRLLPLVGGLVSGNKEAYEYLPNSIDDFLTTDMMLREMRENGFDPLYVQSFSMGISTLFIARKIKKT